jgi:hypothetical protein
MPVVVISGAHSSRLKVNPIDYFPWMMFCPEFEVVDDGASRILILDGTNAREKGCFCDRCLTICQASQLSFVCGKI